MQRAIRILKIFLLVIIGIYLGAFIMTYAFQTRMIFYPGKLKHDHKFDLGENVNELFLRTGDGELINALFFKGSRKEVMLYFHGNAGDLSTWQHVSHDFTISGYSFLIIDYRGYGKSSGKITEKGLYNDADAAWNYLTIEQNIKPSDIIIYGRSIGSGVAVDLASRKNPKGLVLESAFSSLKKLAQEKVPWLMPSLWLKFTFDNAEKIELVTSPTILIHGDSDSLIPLHHSEILAGKVKSRKKLFVISNGGHNNLSFFKSYYNALASFSEWF